MITESTPEQRLHAQPWKDHQRRQARQMILPRVATGLNSTSAPPTASERQFVMLGFILGALSIFCGFFPICGLPIAISGLIIGLAGRRIRYLHRVATWTIALSTTGLILALVNIIISISIYLSFYLWR